MIETRRLTIEGLNTSVLVGGAGQSGEAVVFVHGNPDAGSDWMPLMTRVAPFARVIAPDLPGFGAADARRDNDYTIYSYARFLNGVIREFDLTRVHLVAHDYGGPFAAAWAADHPDHVGSVTFINTGVLIGYRWHRMARLWRTPVVGELVMRAIRSGSARTMLVRENPGLPVQWVNTIVGHLMPEKTRRAVLKLYRSTRPADMDQLAARLRQAYAGQ
jgi:pimeloyl-ACP methyl ester carboxylesterase